MPTRQQHIKALREYLNDVLAGRIADDASQTLIGLSADAHSTLHWLRQSPFAGCNSTDTVLVIGFGDGCAGALLPRRLRSPLDGSWVPVQSVRGGYAGQVQSAVSVEMVNCSIPATVAGRGMLGGILRHNSNPAQLLALTAGHVVGASSSAGVGDAVSLTFADNPSMMGRLFNWSPDFMNVPPETHIDAGLVQLSAQALEPFARQQSEWPLRAVQPFANSTLWLRARDDIFSGGGQEYLSCRMKVTSDETRFYFVRDALCWNVSQPTQDGDSGAPIWTSDDELVAIHTGTAPPGVDKNAVAVPIFRILRWAGASLVSRGEALTQVAPPRNGTLLSGEAISVAPKPQPQPAAPAATQFTPEVVTLARTMWGEARSEPNPPAGLAAVAHVVLNRRAQMKYWGSTIEQVCTKPFQFSCWNPRDPNLPLLQRVTESDSRFALALKVAEELVSLNESARATRDLTGNATHYYARQLQPPPRWARGKTPCALIGNHLFFRDIA